MKNAVLQLVLTLLVSVNFSEFTDDVAWNYIDQFSPIAQSEMQRTGIPASIKMAQGILESNCGRSTLSRNSKNHFGIKCGKNWTGGTFEHEDDDYDKNGKKIKSCFRSYTNPSESFMAHSEFLLGNRRYAFLFELDKTDFRGWAKGLKKAGYATDKKYPSKLIKIIEKYRLHELDVLTEEGYNNEEIIAYEEAKTDEPIVFHEEINQDPIEEQYIDVRRVNGISTIPVEKGETWQEVAQRAHMSVAQLTNMNYQENPSYKDEVKQPYLFLQPLAKEYRGKEEKHLVEYGEKMTDIALKYGVQVEKLVAMNRLPDNAMPNYGEEISLKSYIQWGKRPAFTTVNSIDSEEEVLFAFEEL